MAKKTSKKSNYKKPIKNRKLIITLSIIGLLIVSLVGGVATYGLTMLGKINKVDLNENNLGIDKAIDEKLSKYDGIANIALFGIDATDGNVGRSDAIMIATVDKIHNKLKLTSIMRDSYVDIQGHGKDKINHAYAFGGHELALKTLNENFDLNLKDFATVNFSSLPKIIDSIGGIDLGIRNDELQYINNYIGDLNTLNKTNVSNITSAGTQHVNGTQALAYCRIRYTAGGDGERTERQRIVLSKLFDKFSKISPTKYPSILNELMPMITTSLSSSDILGLAKTVASISESGLEQERFPKDDYSKGEMIHGVYYLTFNKEATVKQIHDYIFEDIKN
ncbi:LCP family protein [Clostridium perfringens]|uniref:LCP family protein n=1 Tax=Clostridium perfringens TaxID=1502 RepID=UPI0003186DDC|nr:LCP family protein [Clostridium perfringens]MBP2860617.1 LCP family protein [Clostridium perfringens]MDH5061161.1 Regulatory protein MsrR [Clostridium perfringens NCTC 8239]CAG9338856.1 cell envelope-related function transcriptional attenuator [Clostridium perfringens NCTC 8239]SQB40923.1 cell envelope-related function transcriptional attenuator [Clostridium perfringens]SUY21248.1 cell envelope-related function transcriptional attenuator [Clostridium perfringens]